MNQKDEIKKQQDKLKDLELQLDAKKKLFNDKYSEVYNKLQNLKAQTHLLYELKEKISQDIASVVSDDVTRYVSGYDNTVKEETYGNINITDYQQRCDYQRMVQDIIWQKFHTFLKDSPQLQSIEEDINSLYAEEYLLKNNAQGYHELEQEIHDLESEIYSTKSFIEELSDIDKFKNHAKRMKTKEEEDRQSALLKQSRDKYSQWFDEHYLPKMKEALLSSLKGIKFLP